MSHTSILADDSTIHNFMKKERLDDNYILVKKNVTTQAFLYRVNPDIVA